MLAKTYFFDEQGLFSLTKYKQNLIKYHFAIINMKRESNMKKIGILGWRGMVGSVLLERMYEEQDLNNVEPFYFSTSMSGEKYTDKNEITHTLLDAYSINELKKMDIIISCQGGEHTKVVYGPLRSENWDGYWIDASSAKRMDKDSVIVLDPINNQQILDSIDNGVKNFIGGNCSITLPLIGLSGLLKKGLIEWMSIMTYQAASGAGASHVRELLEQMTFVSKQTSEKLKNKSSSALSILNDAQSSFSMKEFPKKCFEAPLACGIIPWIDSDLGNGSSREEWKGEVEANKILGLSPKTISIDGLCVRIGALRSHSSAITMKLKKDLDIKEVERLIVKDNSHVEFIENCKASTVEHLSPIHTNGSLKVAVGRLKKMQIDKNVYSVMTIGDQLLWGAAEPLRRALRIILEQTK